MTTTTISFCPACGAPHKLFAVCKRCGVEAIRGTMDEMAARQSAYAAPAPAAAPSDVPSDYLTQVRAAMSEARRASLAATARVTRAPWQRRCTCGHCMTCIGE